MTPFMRYIPTYVRMYVCKRGRGECLEHNVHLFTLPSARTLPFFAQTSSLSLSFKAFPIDCHIPLIVPLHLLCNLPLPLSDSVIALTTTTYLLFPM